MIDPLSPVASASAPASLGGVGTVSTRGAASAPADFGAMLAQMATNTVDALKSAEAASIGGVQGKASVQQVVEAVMSAEQTLQGAIAIRDKVVSSYLEISRMAI
jgi:flagellar hook-basal body complex protein FliE